MYRIYFDGNDGPGDDTYGLWLSKSVEDLAKIPDGPKAGMVVTIYMIGEIEMDATLEWNSKWDAWVARPLAWVARPLEGTVRPNTETWDQHAFVSMDRDKVARS